MANRIPVYDDSAAAELILSTIATYLRKHSCQADPYIVGIGGRLASGKSTFLRRLANECILHFPVLAKDHRRSMILVKLDDMVIPWEERKHTGVFSDKVDVSMVRDVENCLSRGCIVHKHVLTYTNDLWRLSVPHREVQRLLTNNRMFEEKDKLLVCIPSLTKIFRARGIISLASNLCVDVSTEKANYNTIERFDPTGHVVLLEGVTVALSGRAIRSYAHLLYLWADIPTRRENIVLRAFDRYGHLPLTLDDIVAQSVADDWCQAYVNSLARKRCTMIIDTSRPICPAEAVRRVLHTKLMALQVASRRKQSQDGTLKHVVQQIRAFLDVPEKDVCRRLGVTWRWTGDEEHLHAVLNARILYAVLDFLGGTLSILRRRAVGDGILRSLQHSLMDIDGRGQSK